MGSVQKWRIPVSLVCSFLCAFSSVFTQGDHDMSCETLLLLVDHVNTVVHGVCSPHVYPAFSLSVVPA